MHKTTRAWGLLAAQFVALGSLALPDGPRRRRPPKRSQRALGWVMIVSGGGFGAWAGLRLGSALTPLPFPRAGARVRKGGPYAFTRHPIYASILVAAIGRCLATGGPRHALTTLGLIGVLNAKAEFEEELLSASADYVQYMRQVPRWGLGARK